MSGSKFRVLYDFEAEDESELSVIVGDIVEVLSEEDGMGWVYAEDSAGNQGKVPENYLEPVSEQNNHPEAETSSQDYYTNTIKNDASSGDDDGEYDGEYEDFDLLHAHNNKDSSHGVSQQNLHSLGNTTPEIFIIIDNVGKTCSWKARDDIYTCHVGDAKKGSKFAGMKSFVEYSITPSFNNIQVFRRYKHFDWLREAFKKTEKYIIFQN